MGSPSASELLNLLANPSFDGGTWGATFTGQAYGEIDVPEEWVAFWKDRDAPTPWDPPNRDGHKRPEMKVIAPVTPYLDPPRVQNNAGKALFFFGYYGTLDAGVYQQVPGVEPGALLEAGGAWHAWSGNGDDPHWSDTDRDGWRNLTCRIGIDPTGGTDPWGDAVIWGAPSYAYNRYDALQPARAIALASTVTVFLRARSLWRLEHNDVYADNLYLNVIGYEIDPLPDFGLPRVEYARTYLAVPPDCTLDEWLAAARAAYPQRWTLGNSTDDAGIGALEKRNVILGQVRPGAWNVPQMRGWFDTYYPGASVTDKVLYASPPSGPGTGEPGTPPAPSPGEPEYSLRSNNLIGLHAGFVRARTWEYVERSGTTVHKAFTCGDAWEAARRAPGIVSVWRKYVGNESGRIYEHASIRDAARWYVDQYAAEIAAVCAHRGLTEGQLLATKLYIESLNETLPTHNPGVLQDAVAFDVHFCELVHARWGDAVGTVLLNGAVGNPHETEVLYLLPAARIAAQHGDLLGYHAYWARNRVRSFLGEHWRYHAGRWMEWDAYFRSQGVYPRYVATEGGICFAADGTSFGSNAGWKACGSFERYLADIAEHNGRVLAWNAQHGNRCAGVALFGYGNWGWDSFELGDGEVKLLLAWSQAPASAQGLGIKWWSWDLWFPRLFPGWKERRDRRAYRAALAGYLDMHEPELAPEVYERAEGLLEYERIVA